MAGKVILVGAGPGDPGLLTLKGQEALLSAEAVVYDRLVGADILAMIPENAEKINVGKRSSHHLVPQGKINEILLKKAQEGKIVVRLKGGDPYLFGRGGEELELLKQNRIPFEVVPGITSALSVPGYAGIPVTHRDYCSSVHIITGHAKQDGALHIDYSSLVRLGGTIVFLMSVTSMGDLMKGLLQAGMRADMPAAAIERGTLPQQRKILANISTLEERARQAGIKSPALMVVGQVCSLSNEFDWFSGLPLHGATVLVTRPKERAGTLSGKLKALGANVISYPCIRTEELEPNREASAALENLSAYGWLVLTSPAGVVTLQHLLERLDLDARALAPVKLAAIGAGTARELMVRVGIKADFVPEIYDALHLAQGLALFARPEERILILRAEDGTSELTQGLASAGLSFDDVPVYKTLHQCGNREEVAAMLTGGEIGYVTFTSASTVTAFVESLPAMDFSKVKGVCIGRSTQQQAKKYGINTITAKNATIDDLITVIQEDYFHGND